MTMRDEQVMGVPAAPSGWDASRRVFIEHDCHIGGVSCHAWAAWFQACEDADPTSIEEERDPNYLSNFPFDPDLCGAFSAHCAMRRAAPGRPDPTGAQTQEQA